MVYFLTCPACGFQMRKGLFRKEGFECPNCGTFLHLDERITYLVAVLSIALAVLIPYLAGLDGLTFFLASIVLIVVLLVIGCVALAYYYPKLAVGLPPHGSVILHIPPPVDPAGNDTHQADQRKETPPGAR
jgi:hypothetical protein